MRDDKPIIHSMTQMDFYKFTMGQEVFLNHPDVPVCYGFKCRTKSVRLPDHIDIGQLREELDHVRSLRFTNSELHYLRGTNEYQERMFSEPYLQFLKNLHLPEYHLEYRDGETILQFPGKWSEAIYWEIPPLAIVNELYYRSQMKKLSKFEQECIYAEGLRRLQEKIKILKTRPDIRFSEFGTRRAFSQEWLRRVNEILADELPSSQFMGTSNTYLAMLHGLLPMGTSAHERDMGLAAIMDNDPEGNGIRASLSQSLQNWWDLYRHGLSIALPDTFGSNFFFRTFTPAQARMWKGLRWDSGDPIAGILNETIPYYRRCGLSDAEIRNKLFIPSDGLELPQMIQIQDLCGHLISLLYGWGTNLTNDLGFAALSIVIKLIMAAGRGTVKLSNNPAKGMGDEKDQKRYIQVVDYHGQDRVECKY